ncbi:uncharacterized protein LOC143909804 isoform X2 [Arctopsyche grandis]|uniref:uncharacterized protein LOC143909804 isoform X2 n=1 Tax=Arctopsyche grandis TaxID=121162 RepID=UPI00406D8EE3
MSSGVCEQQFCLRWNNFQANITSQFEALRDQEDFVDVTLACEGRRLQAHKVVLSACSPYFKDLFKSNPCPHPIIFMRDCELIHITALLEFMYAGEVNISQAQLTAFLRTAEALQIRGLTDSPDKNKQEIKNSTVKTQSSQLRNLLCGRLHHQTPNAKDSSQNTASNNYQKTAKIISQSRKGLRSEHKPLVVPSHNGMSETLYSGLLSGSNNDYEMSDDGNRLKDNILLSNQEDENYEYNISENNSLLLNENDNTNSGKINPFAVGNFSGIHADFPHEMIEPKIEVPDYTSDDETRQERAFNSEVLYSNDSSAHLSTNLMSIQGRETGAGTSQAGKNEIEGVNSFSDGTARVKEEIGAGTGSSFESLENLEGLALGLGRRSWLGIPEQFHHQHRRLIAKHDPGPPRLIKLGEGIELLEEQVRSVKWADYRKLTRSLAALLFSPAELATCSVTGQRWSRAGLEERPTKPPLDRHKVQAIISYVSRRFPMIEVSRIKQVLAYKCKENCTALKMKSVRSRLPAP